MTHRERLLKVLRGEIPDCVPVAPDFSNMIPARLTGKAFWDLYLYNDPPIWDAYLDCAKYFDIDAVMDGYFPLTFPEDQSRIADSPQTYIVFQDKDRIITQNKRRVDGKDLWDKVVNVYYRADPPTHQVGLDMLGLPEIPSHPIPLDGVKEVDLGPEGLARILDKMGDQGLVGVWLTSTCALGSEKDIYRYYDHPELHDLWIQERIEQVEKRFRQIMSMKRKPDFLCVGGSGSLVFQSVDIFRHLALPAVKRGIELATAAGIPTHVHSCGPEKQLVEIFSNETELTMIDPLEIPPMGNCDLADLKHKFGDRITLKGNLHTTQVMLRGSVKDVIAAAKKAIDDAGEGGRFILSTGDQCGRDTPDENLFAMVETARTYGRY